MDDRILRHVNGLGQITQTMHDCAPTGMHGEPQVAFNGNALREQDRHRQKTYCRL